MKFHCKFCDTRLFIPDEKVMGQVVSTRCRICKGMMKIKDTKVFPYIPIRSTGEAMAGFSSDIWPNLDILAKMEGLPEPIGGERSLNELELLH